MRSGTARPEAPWSCGRNHNTTACGSRWRTTAKAFHPSIGVGSSRSSSAWREPKGRASDSASTWPGRASSRTEGTWGSRANGGRGAASGSRCRCPGAAFVPAPRSRNGAQSTDVVVDDDNANVNLSLVALRLTERLWAKPLPPSFAFVLLPLAPQRRGVYREHVRRLLLRAGAGEHAQDVLALDLLDGEVATELRHGGRGLCDPVRECLRLQHLGGGEDDRALDGIAQFADVPRPGIGEKCPFRLRRELLRRAARRAGEEAEKAPRQREDLLAPLAQRRDGDLDDVEAEEKVLAEVACADRVVGIATGGGHDAGGRAPGPRLSHPLELLVLQEAQQLGLDRGRDLAHLVEEEGTTFRRFHPPRLIAHRSRESALDMSEHLARQQLLAEVGAVHDCEGTATSRALPVERSRQDGLARAAFAAQEHGNVVGGGAADHVEHRAHGGARRRKHHFRRGVRELLLEVGHARGQLDARARLLDGALDLRRRERLGQIVAGAAADRGDRGVDGRGGGDDEHLEGGPLRQQRTEKVQPALLSQPQIDEREIVRQARERVDRGSRRSALRDPAAQG